MDIGKEIKREVREVPVPRWLPEKPAREPAKEPAREPASEPEKVL